jgi:hypothetical protein
MLQSYPSTVMHSAFPRREEIQLISKTLIVNAFRYLAANFRALRVSHSMTTTV